MYETLYTDMLENRLRNETVTSCSGVEKIISISKEQTPEEIEHTKQFSAEIVELLKCAPDCSVAVNQFMTSYYHRFGKQCHVAYYGFSELIELFEAIPSVVEVKGAAKYKMICLVESLKFKILAERLIAVIKLQPSEMVEIIKLNYEFTRVHRYPLQPTHFGCYTVQSLLEKLKDSFQIMPIGERRYLCLIHPYDSLHQISLNIRRILMEQFSGTMLIQNACNLYQKRFGPQNNLVSHFKEIPDVIKIIHGYLHLTPLQLVAKWIIILLQENSGQMPLSNLEVAFLLRFGFPLCAANYQFETLDSLLKHLSDYFKFEENRNERLVLLRSNTAAVDKLPPHSVSSVSSLKEKQSKRDILNESVPSRLPSPIKPCVKEKLDESVGSGTSLTTDVSCVPKLKFEYRILNATVAVPNVVRTSMTPAVAKSMETLPQKRSTVAGATHSVSALEISANPSVHLPQDSSNECQGTATNFHQTIEEPVSSAIDKRKQKVTYVILEAGNPLVKHNDCEQVENFVSIPNGGKKISEVFTKCSNESLGTKDDIASSLSTSINNGRHQKRRSRIAAKFSVCMND